MSTLIAVLLGLATPLASSEDAGLDGVAATIFVAVTLLQTGMTLLLFRLDRQDFRKALRVYYAIAAFFCLAVTVGGSFRPIIGPFLGGMMSVGLTAIAFTAFYVLTNWSALAQTQPDAAVFLGSTHVLALVAVGAATVRASFPGSGEWVAALAQTTFLSLTALALPLAAGLWVRLSIHARAKKNVRSCTEIAAPGVDVARVFHPIAVEQRPELGEKSSGAQILRQDSLSVSAAPATVNVATAVVVAVALATTTAFAFAAHRRR